MLKGMIVIFPESGRRVLSRLYRPREELCCDALGWVVYNLGVSADSLIRLDVLVLYMWGFRSRFLHRGAGFVVCIAGTQLVQQAGAKKGVAFPLLMQWRR